MELEKRRDRRPWSVDQMQKALLHNGTRRLLPRYLSFSRRCPILLFTLSSSSDLVYSSGSQIQLVRTSSACWSLLYQGHDARFAFDVRITSWTVVHWSAESPRLLVKIYDRKTIGRSTCRIRGGFGRYGAAGESIVPLQDDRSISSIEFVVRVSFTHSFFRSPSSTPKGGQGFYVIDDSETEFYLNLFMKALVLFAFRRSSGASRAGDLQRASANRRTLGHSLAGLDRNPTPRNALYSCCDGLLCVVKCAPACVVSEA